MDLVFLHGPAASGKLTIARAPEARVGFPVFHNHLVVDLLTTVFPFGSEPLVRLREQFWTSVFTDAARVGRSITFTFAPEAAVRPSFAGRVRRLIEAEGGRGASCGCTSAKVNRNGASVWRPGRSCTS